MSEYWKSTPKYWCKFCSTYVKDTKFERQQHEATGKHQGSVQRSLRNLHKQHDQEERDKQRAKDEVARLNDIVSGNAGTGATSSSKHTTPALKAAAAAPPKQFTAEDRKKQLQSLADMGIAVPDDFRKEVAMVGQWQTVERKVEEEEIKPDALSFGVRKRKLHGDEDGEEEEAAGQGSLPNKKRWGTAVREYPGESTAAEDIETLLAGDTTKPIDASPPKKNSNEEEGPKEMVSKSDETIVKQEDGVPQVDDKIIDVPPVIFKKRKPKILK